MKLGENGVGGGGPHERTTMQVVMGHIGIDLLHQLLDAAEGTAPDCLLRDESEPTLDLIEPAGVSGRVMNVVALMTCKPSFNFGMFVRAVVVGDEVDV